jgi:hypothetical protein
MEALPGKEEENLCVLVKGERGPEGIRYLEYSESFECYLMNPIHFLGCHSFLVGNLYFT